MKKLLSVLLATIMIMAAMTVNAFAAGEGSITIYDATKSATYSAYKILDLQYTANGAGAADDSYVYTVATDSPWKGFIETTTDTNGGYYLTVDQTGHVAVGTLSDANVAEFTLKAKQYAETNNIEPEDEIEADDTEIVFDDLDLGYYLVFSDADTASLSMLTNTATDAVIKDKNYTPAIFKYAKERGLWENANNGFVGEVLEYRIDVLAEQAPSRFIIRDALDENHLILIEDSITVTSNRDTDGNGETDITENLVAGDDFGISTSDDGFEIIFEESFLETVETNDIIQVLYEAYIAPGITGHGATTGHYNTATLLMGDSDAMSATTYTYTYYLPIFKYTTETNGERTPLEGAKFIMKNTTELDFMDDYLVLYDADTETPMAEFPADVDGDYYIYWTPNASEATTLVSDEYGKILVAGIDAGTYQFIETAPPAGYSKLTGEVAASINGIKNQNAGLINNGIDLQDGSNLLWFGIENKKGIALPETGGIGTTIFYVAGGVLVLGAAVVLLTKKKTEENN